MLNKVFTWELDPYGTNTDNDIVGERKVLSNTQDGTFMFIIPNGAPFYGDTAVVRHLGTGRVLTKGVDWEPGYMFELVSSRTYKPVYGAICILDNTLTGTFEYDYHTLGGEYTLDEQSLLTLLSNALTDPRVTTWEKITDIPWYFTPIQHLFNVQDMVGGKELADALNLIADRILAAADSLYPAINVHIQDKANPHAVTKAQVGLGNVSNFPLSTEEEALEGVRLDRYISPGHVSKMIAKLNSTSVAGHVSDKSNPHAVTKIQVGLGSVDNFATASDTSALDKENDSEFLTPRKAWLAISNWIADAVTAHMANTSNPHGVTKAQLGLGNVQNLGLATEADAVGGTGNDGYMTPELTKLAIAAQAGASGIQNHLDDHENPHGVTQSQVGLGNVPNYPLATEAQAIDGLYKLGFMTPYLTTRLLDENLWPPIITHFNAMSNPHATTKAQVGLGNVSNFATAGDTELEAGTSNSHFVTVAGVVSLIASRIGSAFTDHINDKTNPHVVTKAQVGLGNVQNLPIGTDEDYEAGNSNAHYVTIYGVSQMISRLSSETIAGHVSDLDNPHAVTKTQVGLGSVDNFATADQSELDSGSATNRFVTPGGVTSMIIRLVGNSLSEHLNAANNPHGVTKVQVGLGLVQNYGMASADDATLGEADDLYMSPLATNAAISAAISGFSSSIDQHIANTENPHGVTAIQLGLGNVQNYAMATQEEALLGSADDLYMSPATTMALVSATVQSTTIALADHVNDTNNPHGITSASIGLGNVVNTGFADDATLDEATSNSYNVSPYGVKRIIDNVLAAFSLTKADIGLGDVVNAGFADDETLDAGTATDVYVSPYGVKRIVDAIVGAISITKEAVGLGDVDNYATAVDADVDSSATDKFVTPAVAMYAAQVVHKANTLPLKPVESFTAENIAKYRILYSGIVMTLPVATEGEIRVIVDHATSDLIVMPPAEQSIEVGGSTSSGDAGPASSYTCDVVGKEYVFYCWDGVWRIS